MPALAIDPENPFSANLAAYVPLSKSAPPPRMSREAYIQTLARYILTDDRRAWSATEEERDEAQDMVNHIRELGCIDDTKK